MTFSVTMPALGESVSEGTVTRWLKSEGDHVAMDEPLLEVSTDKVDTEIPSPVAAFYKRLSLQLIKQFQLEQSSQSSPMAQRQLRLQLLQRQLLLHLHQFKLPHHQHLPHQHLQLLQHLPEQLLLCRRSVRALAKELLHVGLRVSAIPSPLMKRY